MSTPDLICGIDPGKTGGIALLTLNGDVFGAYPMPETEADLSELLSEFSPRIAKAMIERVQPFGGARAPGKANIFAMFKLGKQYGTLRGILTVLQIPFDEVQPRVWQTSMACLTGGKKAISRQKAQQLFPKCPVRITDKIADALLIAECLRRRG